MRGKVMCNVGSGAIQRQSSGWNMVLRGLFEKWRDCPNSCRKVIVEAGGE